MSASSTCLTGVCAAHDAPRAGHGSGRSSRTLTEVTGISPAPARVATTAATPSGGFYSGMCPFRQPGCVPALPCEPGAGLPVLPNSAALVSAGAAIFAGEGA